MASAPSSNSKDLARFPGWESLERIAWIRPGALGDLVVGLASLAEVPRFFPRARVTVVGPKAWLEVLSPDLFAFVDRIAVVERKGMTAKLFERSNRSGASEEAKGAAWMPSTSGGGSAKEISLARVLAECDGVINTNIDSLRYGFAAFRAGVKVRLGSAPPPWTWLYTHGSPYFGKDPLLHERDVPLLQLELADDGITRHFTPVSSHRARIKSLVEGSELVKTWRDRGLPRAKTPDLARAAALVGHATGAYVLFNPTASVREKTWPVERMRALIDDVTPDLARLGAVPVVIGAPNETEWLREVAGSAIAIVQPKSLAELQDVVAGARALVANASSMQFIAGTTGTPVLTIFGRGQPVIWGPVGRHDRIVRAKFSGADAGQTFAGLEEEARIYRTIEVSDVAAELRHLLADTSRDR